jgi:hypothetical protein
MNTAVDILKYEETLRAGGFKENDIHVLARATADLMDSNLASKNDLAKIEASLRTDLAKVEAALKTDIASVRKDIETDIASVRKDIEVIEERINSVNDRTKIILWVVGVTGFINILPSIITLTKQLILLSK